MLRRLETSSLSAIHVVRVMQVPDRASVRRAFSICCLPVCRLDGTRAPGILHFGHVRSLCDEDVQKVDVSVNAKARRRDHVSSRYAYGLCDGFGTSRGQLSFDVTHFFTRI